MRSSLTFGNGNGPGTTDVGKWRLNVSLFFALFNYSKSRERNRRDCLHLGVKGGI